MDGGGAPAGGACGGGHTVDLDGSPEGAPRAAMEGQDGVGGGLHHHDLGRTIPVEVGHGRGTAGEVVAFPEYRAVDAPGAVARHELEVAVSVEVGQGVEVHGVRQRRERRHRREGREHGAIAAEHLVAHGDFGHAVSVHVTHGGRGVSTGHARDPSQQPTVGSEDDGVPGGGPVALGAGDHFGARGAWVDVGEGHGRSWYGAVARVFDGPEPPTVGAGHRTEHPIGDVIAPHKGTEHHVGDVVAVDAPVAVVVGEVGHHGLHHYLVVHWENVPIARPCPFEPGFEARRGGTPFAGLGVRRARQAAQERGFAVVSVGAALEVVAGGAWGGARAEVAHLSFGAAGGHGACATAGPVAAIEDAGTSLAAPGGAAAHSTASLGFGAAEATRAGGARGTAHPAAGNTIVWAGDPSVSEGIGKSVSLRGVGGGEVGTETFGRDVVGSVARRSEVGEGLGVGEALARWIGCTGQQGKGTEQRSAGHGGTDATGSMGGCRWGGSTNVRRSAWHRAPCLSWSASPHGLRA